eukprot:TRINITY_DN202_c0_g1_i3.p1 TRINITY_DN202_c0_g1~~TRINITY_DN202_c0_g1_i3.p1  ORF type:complete len:246 (-),score=74.17 TRINITY_DN202_c0_g1_i3:769-1506(-)
MNLVNYCTQKNDLLFANFNRDLTHLWIGTTDGFTSYTCSPFSKFLERMSCGIGIIEQIASSPLVALVGIDDDNLDTNLFSSSPNIISQSAINLSPRRLVIFNTKDRSQIYSRDFVTPIVAVKSNRKRLVVVLETKIHIIEISSMKELQVLETSPNPKGICDLSASDASYLAYPVSKESGLLKIFNALSVMGGPAIEAHSSQISLVVFSKDGNLVATASTKVHNQLPMEQHPVNLSSHFSLPSFRI